MGQGPRGRHRLHHPLERHAVVAERVKHHALGCAEMGLERGVSIHAVPQRQSVDEKPHKRLQLHPRPARRGCADHHVRPRTKARQQRRKGRRQHHEKARPFAARQGLQPRRHRRRQMDRNRTATIVHHRRARPVRRQHHRLGDPGKLIAPPRGLLAKPISRQHPTLPGRIVGILDRQIWERGALPRQRRAVERRQLLEQKPHRPTVEHRVVPADHQKMLRVRAPQQQRPEERP